MRTCLHNRRAAKTGAQLEKEMLAFVRENTFYLLVVVMVLAAFGMALSAEPMPLPMN